MKLGPKLIRSLRPLQLGEDREGGASRSQSALHMHVLICIWESRCTVGHRLATPSKQRHLWIFCMSQHWNPATALSDHRASLTLFTGNSPHRAAYYSTLAPNRVKVECLSPEGCHLPTHLGNSGLRLATATNHETRRLL